MIVDDWKQNPQSPGQLKATTSDDIFSFKSPSSIFRHFWLFWLNSSLLKNNKIHTTSVQVIQLPQAKILVLLYTYI